MYCYFKYSSTYFIFDSLFIFHILVFENMSYIVVVSFPLKDVLRIPNEYIYFFIKKTIFWYFCMFMYINAIGVSQNVRLLFFSFVIVLQEFVLCIFDHICPTFLNFSQIYSPSISPNFVACLEEVVFV